MAYDFSGSSQDISFASVPVTAAPLTMAFWGNMDAASSNENAVSISDAASNNFFAIRFNNRNIQARTSASGTVSNATTSTQLTLNTWFHAAGVYSSDSLRTAYLNAGGAGTNTNTRTPSGIDRGNIGSRTSDNFINGRLAEVGIWNAALTVEELQMLTDGFTCNQVRPQSLVFYAPLIRDLSDLAQGRTLTNNNGATVDIHPRIYS